MKRPIAARQRGATLGAVLTLVSLSPLAGCSSTPEQEPPAELGSYTRSARVTLQWEGIVGAKQRFDVARLRPHVHNDRVYTVDPTGLLSARALASGERLWRKPIGAWVSAGVGGGDGRLLVATREGRVVALAAEDAAPLWSARMPSEVLTVPVLGEGRVVVRSVDGRVLALDADSGEPLWNYRGEVPALSLRGAGEPLIDRGAVYLGLDNGRVVALSLQDGNVIWEQSIAVPRGRSEVERLVDLDVAPVRDANALYLSGYQGRVVELAVDTGVIRWSREMSTNQPLALDDRRLFVTDADGVIWALDRETGSALWQQDRLRRRGLTGVAVHAEFVAFGDFEGYVHWLSRFDGSIAARRRIDDEAITEAPVSIGELLLVQSRGGAVAGLRVARIE